MQGAVHEGTPDERAFEAGKPVLVHGREKTEAVALEAAADFAQVVGDVDARLVPVADRAGIPHRGVDEHVGDAVHHFGERAVDQLLGVARVVAEAERERHEAGLVFGLQPPGSLLGVFSELFYDVHPQTRSLSSIKPDRGVSVGGRIFRLGGLV